jgi:hypothetical protein
MCIHSPSVLSISKAQELVAMLLLRCLWILRVSPPPWPPHTTLCSPCRSLQFPMDHRTFPTQLTSNGLVQQRELTQISQLPAIRPYREFSLPTPSELGIATILCQKQAPTFCSACRQLDICVLPQEHAGLKESSLRSLSMKGRQQCARGRTYACRGKVPTRHCRRVS